MCSAAGRQGFAGRECEAHHGDAREVDHHLTNIRHLRLEVFLPHIADVAGLLVMAVHCHCNGVDACELRPSGLKTLEVCPHQTTVKI